MQYFKIAERFHQAYNGATNFMTPHVVTYGKRGAHLFEISRGEGFRGQAIHGVTVITTRGEKRHDLSKCFETAEEASAYARSLPRE